MESKSTKPSSSTPTISAKLPKLELPKFSGNVLEYHDFHQSFLSAVDTASLVPSQKLNYLRSLLKGEAAALISGLEISDANYAVALDLLSNRCGSKSHQIRAHVRSLLSYSCSDSKDVSTYRTFIDGISKHMRGLESYGMSSDDYGQFLCEILIDKVPNKVKNEWAALDDEDMNLENLLRLVEIETKKVDIVKHTTGSGLTITPLVSHSPARFKQHTNIYGN